MCGVGGRARMQAGGPASWMLGLRARFCTGHKVLSEMPYAACVRAAGERCILPLASRRPSEGEATIVGVVLVIPKKALVRLSIHTSNCDRDFDFLHRVQLYRNVELLYIQEVCQTLQVCAISAINAAAARRRSASRGRIGDDATAARLDFTHLRGGTPHAGRRPPGARALHSLLRP